MAALDQTKETFLFSFSIKSKGLAPFTHLKLFNAQNDIVYLGYGELSGLQLPKGLYMLRIELNEYLEDRHYRVLADVSDSISKFRLNSTIPIKGFASTRQEFAEAAQRWTNFSTRTRKKLSGSVFFLYMSFVKEPATTDFPAMINGWKILDAGRKVYLSLSEGETKMSLYTDKREKRFTGTICFSDKLDPGQYYLVYEGDGLKREMPVYVYKNFQTQVFMRFAGQPLFSSIRISISRDCFNCSDLENVYMEAMTAKINNGLYVLPEKLKNAALEGKWENPMLGILASYMYLMSSEKSDDALFTTILGRLEHEILESHDSPDIAALKLLRAKHFSELPVTQSINSPCMLGIGMSLFLDQSIAHPSLVFLGEEVESIFPLLQKDSIWTTYEPLPVATVSKFSLNEPFGPGTNELLVKFGKELWSTVNRGEVLKPGMLSSLGVQEDPPATPAPVDWVTSSIVSQLSGSTQNPDIKVEELAQQLQVSTNMVRSKLDLIQKNENIKEMATDILGKISKNAMSKIVNRLNISIDTLLNPKSDQDPK